jgi:hypothetical protein
VFLGGQVDQLRCVDRLMQQCRTGYERVRSNAAPASCADQSAGWLRYSVYASGVLVLCRAELRAAMPVGCFIELVDLR